MRTLLTFAVSSRQAVTTIYTIGHSKHALEHFMHLLREHGICTLVDVRTHPYSKWAPHFQQTVLSRSMRAEGIEYVFLGRELGGRPDGAEFYDEGGRVDYARRSKAFEFQTGIERLSQIAALHLVAIMCAEENPVRCHRRLLVTPVLEQRGVAVRHIRGDGRDQSDAELTDATPQLPLF